MGKKTDRNRQAADDILIRRMGIACWITMAAEALMICHCFPTEIMVSACASILRLMYTVCVTQLLLQILHIYKIYTLKH